MTRQLWHYLKYSRLPVVLVLMQKFLSKTLQPTSTKEPPTARVHLQVPSRSAQTETTLQSKAPGAIGQTE